MRLYCLSHTVTVALTGFKQGSVNFTDVVIVVIGHPGDLLIYCSNLMYDNKLWTNLILGFIKTNDHVDHDVNRVGLWRAV